MLTRFLELLEVAQEDHWSNYFQKTIDLCNDGKIVKAKKHFRGAFGGMGSFTDTCFYNFLSETEHQEVMELQRDLLEMSKDLTLIERLFG